jgi:putative transposase
MSISKAMPTAPKAHNGIAAWFAFYNDTRSHQSLGNRTPMAAWREGMSGGLPERPCT